MTKVGRGTGAAIPQVRSSTAKKSGKAKGQDEAKSAKPAKPAVVPYGKDDVQKTVNTKLDKMLADPNTGLNKTIEKVVPKHKSTKLAGQRVAGMARARKSTSAAKSAPARNTAVVPATTSGTKTYRTASGKTITMPFVPEKPAPKKGASGSGRPVHKQGSGDPAPPRKALEGMIPKGKLAQWKKLDKHNVADVRRFMGGLKLTTEQKANFVQSYLKGYYNHCGGDAKWGGAKLQEAIDAVPTDSKGRRYLDCEGYLAIAQNLLGKDNVKAYAVDADGKGKRNHQVGIFREGNNFFVLNNHQVTKVDDARRRPVLEVIQRAHPGYSKAVEDKNGPMAHGTETYKAGDTLKGKPDHSVAKVYRDGKTMIVYRAHADHGSYHLRGVVDPKTGDIRLTFRPRKDDVVKSGKFLYRVTDQKAATPTRAERRAGRDSYPAELTDGKGKKIRGFLQFDQNIRRFKFVLPEQRK